MAQFPWSHFGPFELAQGSRDRYPEHKDAAESERVSRRTRSKVGASSRRTPTSAVPTSSMGCMTASQMREKAPVGAISSRMMNRVQARDL